MIIEMSDKEFQEVRKFVGALKNPKVTKAFNEIFSKEPTGGVKGFVNPLSNNKVIEVPEHLTYEVEKVLVKYAPDIGKMTKGGASITAIPKFLNVAKNIFSEITDAITNR